MFCFIQIFTLHCDYSTEYRAVTICGTLRVRFLLNIFLTVLTKKKYQHYSYHQGNAILGVKVTYSWCQCDARKWPLKIWSRLQLASGKYPKKSGKLRNPFYFVAIFSKIVACVTSGIMRIYQDSIRIHFSVCLDLYFWLELNLMISFRNEDVHLWKQNIWAQKCHKLVFSSFSTLFVKPNRQVFVWMHLVILWMGVAGSIFDSDLQLKKRSSFATILD